MKNEVVLNPETLYNWDFKIDARGYRPQEVDKVLDMVISDYKAYDRKVKDLEDKIALLNEEILELRRKLNESVITKKNYNETYKLSIELDELIAKYYGQKLKQGVINKK